MFHYYEVTNQIQSLGEKEKLKIKKNWWKETDHKKLKIIKFIKQDISGILCRDIKQYFWEYYSEYFWERNISVKENVTKMLLDFERLVRKRALIQWEKQDNGIKIEDNVGEK